MPVAKLIDLEYLPAPDSPSNNKKQDEEDEEDDPLDDFMASIERKAKADLDQMGRKPVKKQQLKGTRDDIEKEDEQEEFFKWMEENPNAGVAIAGGGDEEEDKDLEYDREGNIIVPEKNKIIDPLPPIDHSTIDYEPFEKNFYNEHEEISALSAEQSEELRRKLGIKVSGLQPPKPVCSFAHFNFDEPLMKVIRKSDFTQPTPIQAQVSFFLNLISRDFIAIGL
jgi:ATP-dependent RNA helicase DDX42